MLTQHRCIVVHPKEIGFMIVLLSCTEMCSGGWHMHNTEQETNDLVLHVHLLVYKQSLNELNFTIYLKVFYRVRVPNQTHTCQTWSTLKGKQTPATATNSSHSRRTLHLCIFCVSQDQITIQQVADRAPPTLAPMHGSKAAIAAYATRSLKRKKIESK
jgi:hypothetical protein